MLVTVNGERREMPPDASVATVVLSLAGVPEGRGMAVALAGEVVPRTAWSSTQLTEGAHVEIVVAVQGG